MLVSMHSILLSLCLGLFFFLAGAQAQEDTARHRAVYEQINAGLGSLKKVKATHRDDPTIFELEGWFEDKNLRKILSIVPGEDGGGSEEYYLEEGKLLFVYRHYRAAGVAPEKSAPLVEDRFYFADGVMFKWLGNDKKAVLPTEGAFVEEALRLKQNLTNFQAAFGLPKPVEKPPVPAPVSAVEGVFTGIEQGDYAHWKMRDSKGVERSFFILQPDDSIEKVLGTPDTYVGRKCRVQWKTSTEDIPEAGGKMKVEQVLRVEWLKRTWLKKKKA